MKDKLKDEYENIKIPDDYHQKVQKSIVYGLEKQSSRQRRIHLSMKLALSCFLIFIVFLNTSTVFAKTVSQIPYLGQICKVLTFTNQDEIDKTKSIHINAPQLNHTGNTKLERKVNHEIQTMVDRAVDEASTRAEEYYDAFVETGGNPDEFMPVEITIDYEIKYYQDNFVSFLIEKTETLASAYQEYMYYNINLNTGKILTLKDLLGDNYQDVITQEIRKQISAYPEEERSLFFEEVNIKDFINQDRIFYINQDKRIVIKFQKYEIAAGAAGPVEFVIPQNISL
ncbi:MAG: DUF3298 domain-containing protein [Coprobacillus sp.]|nr:MAG: DUF3298 domain-containing protein [Coprobacillus sp.]